MRLTDSQKEVLSKFRGVSEDEFAAAHAKRDDGFLDKPKPVNFEPFANARRRIVASMDDADDGEGPEEMLSRCRNHLEAYDEDGDDARLVSAARCLMRMIETISDPDGAYASRSAMVRFR